ncbi:tripartite tricarboxylate transporter permease [Devosia sp. A449]
MIDLFANLQVGFASAVTPINLLYCLVGVSLGTIIGVLPGIGPSATFALLLPLTYSMPDTAALIMLAGIYYGALYGGSTTAILVNLPGEASSVIACMDGNAMAKKGQAGVALALAAIGSFIAGTIATALVAFVAKPLSSIALLFGPADYTSLVVLGLLFAVMLSGSSPIKSIAMALLGIALSLIGIDTTSGELRYTFGIPQLYDGLDFVVVAIGLFGVSEILLNLQGETKATVSVKTGRLLPSWAQLKQTLPSMLRGTALGSFLGVLPGGGATMASFASYVLERKLSKHPEQFGHGAPEGLAGPESANNAAAQLSFVPLLTLGIPSNGLMALMVGAMMIQGITPGPEVITQRPDLFWGLIASMWIGNLLLLVLNLPLVGLWIKLLSIPYRFLGPAIIMFCLVGAYSISYNTMDVFICAIFGILGFVLKKAGCELTPLILGFILGPLLEENYRLSLLISMGDYSTFFTSPRSLTFLILSTAFIVMMCLPLVLKRRAAVFEGTED